MDPLTKVNLMELHPERLGDHVSIRIARQGFSLQSFVVKVVTRSLVKAWNEGKGSPGPDAETGARLTLQLLRKLFGTVESFQPCFYTIASPRAYPSNHLGTKLSCDQMNVGDQMNDRTTAATRGARAGTSCLGTS